MVISPTINFELNKLIPTYHFDYFVCIFISQIKLNWSKLNKILWNKFVRKLNKFVGLFKAEYPTFLCAIISIPIYSIYALVFCSLSAVWFLLPAERLSICRNEPPWERRRRISFELRFLRPALSNPSEICQNYWCHFQSFDPPSIALLQLICSINFPHIWFGVSLLSSGSPSTNLLPSSE